MERMKLSDAEKVAEAMDCILRIPDEKEQMEQTQMKSVQNGGQYEI